jgi:phage FluMu protein Com
MEKSRTHNFFYNPYTIGIGTIIIGTPIASILYDLSKNKPLLSTIFFLVKWLYTAIITVLTYSIPVYVILIILFVLALIALGDIYIGNRNRKPILPEFINYKTDTLKYFKWSWDWYFNSLHNYWEIKDLNIHCSKCGTKMLTYKSYGNYVQYQCPRCNFQIDSTQQNFEHEHIIDALIKDNLDKRRM